MMPAAGYSDLPMDAVIVCPSCGSKNMRTDNLCNNCDADLGEAKRALLKGRVKRVREIIQRHPELKEKVLVRLGISDLPQDDFYVESGALGDIVYWEEKAAVAENFEKAGNFDGSAHQYEDMELWTEAGRVRSQGANIIREREIVLIKCSYCGSLNHQGTLKCSSCGGRL
jgi:uncharacterized OB-fold protein